MNEELIAQVRATVQALEDAAVACQQADETFKETQRAWQAARDAATAAREALIAAAVSGAL